ncbi:hypothetical protein Sjap_004815 [Stephania japonica]|uniref:Uncharacterized protein n=1 Tax=Stephania japonica TaxID=461633 RepID=A0AAP0K2Z3_9MAGN
MESCGSNMKEQSSCATTDDDKIVVAMLELFNCPVCPIIYLLQSFSVVTATVLLAMGTTTILQFQATFCCSGALSRTFENLMLFKSEVIDFGAAEYEGFDKKETTPRFSFRFKFQPNEEEHQELHVDWSEESVSSKEILKGGFWSEKDFCQCGSDSEDPIKEDCGPEKGKRIVEYLVEEEEGLSGFGSDPELVCFGDRFSGLIGTIDANSDEVLSEKDFHGEFDDSLSH